MSAQPSTARELTPEQWQRAKTLFGDLLECNGADWRDHLASETDPVVAAEVRRLLSADHAATDFLGTSPADAWCRGRNEDDPIIGRELGPFRIEKLLGEGGNGRVYLALRQDVGGHAAIKLLRGRFASPTVTRRFHAEQSILARLDHPNIARLLQVGIAEDGTPWLAMEYVDGRPSREVMATLPIRQRLRMIIKLLGAVDYAHRQLVVHRDIKPGNILVDQRGEPRLLDFGIAKRLDDAGAELTVANHQPRTPAYAAPEQLLGEPITVATDVYAMGVLLYEMLSGCKPWPESGSKLDAAILSGMVSLPSRHISGADRRQMKGDLDAIVLQAMRRDPRERYPSAAAMADDLQRHLDSKPVSAQKQTVAYRSQLFLRRHNRLAVAVLLLVGLLTFALIRESTLRQKASLEAHKSMEVADFMLDIFDAGDSLSSDFTISQSSTVMDLLARGAARLDLLDTAPLVRADLAHKMGQVYWGLSAYGPAERLFKLAIELREKALGPSDETAESYLMLGRTYSRSGRYQDMLEAEQKSYDMRMATVGPDAPGTIHSLHRIGVAYYFLGDLDRADSIFVTAIAAWRKRMPESTLALANSLTMHAHATGDFGRFDAALASAREALSLRQTMLPDHHPLISEGLCNEAAFKSDHRDVVIDYENMARFQLGAGNVDEAERMADKAVGMATRLNAVSPIQVNLDRARQMKVEVLRAQNQLPAALDLQRDVLRSRLTNLPATNGPVIESRSVLADLLRQLKQPVEANEQLNLALHAWRQQPKAYTRQLVDSLNRFADAGNCDWLNAGWSLPMSPPMAAAIQRDREVCGL